MATYRTPDVYVEELSVFPPSVAEVGTAIAAFVGYTQTAKRLVEGDLTLKPTKIYSLKEYEELFGFPNADTFALTLASDGQGGFNVIAATPPTTSYLMHHAVRMYFDNGGAQCYIVSVGGYRTSGTLHEWDPSGTATGLKDGLDALALEDEPTLIGIPELIKCTDIEYQTAVQAVLAQCGRLGDRFGIFDVYAGTRDIVTLGTLGAQRAFYGTNNLKYGAAYYPFVRTSMAHYVNAGETNVSVRIGSGSAVNLAALKTSNTAAYNTAKAELANHFVVMPPSAAVAGVYAATDASRGVWKAPANVSLADVIEPVIKLSNIKQDDLNIDTDGGKSVNAIRTFAGKGTLVWGARTLAGNDNEWRYINVRRFFNMVEESVKKSTYWAVFEPNDANTWTKVRGMIENYLTDKWRDGALAGATPKDAFFVKVGLGSTMTTQDVLQGKMIVEIGMAVVRPAEFIVLKFSHKMQTS
jgi:phage tail sheath protein FI